MNPSPRRIPKGSKEGGRFMPKWAADIRKNQAELAGTMLQITAAIGPRNEQGGIIVGPRSLQGQINDLRSRIGTSTPLIIWNIAVLVAIAWLTAKVYGVAPY